MTLLVYLLCLGDQGDAPGHYVGITTKDRLGKRMMEHRSGKGGKLTQSLASRGEPWWLTNYWLTTDPALEGWLREAGGLAARCPRCSRGWTGRLQQPYTQKEGNPAFAPLEGFPPQKTERLG